MWFGIGRAGLAWWPYLIVALFLILNLAIWAPRGFLAFNSDTIGEAYVAYHSAINIERSGWKWAGLQDHATSSAPQAHPYFYIHHLNIGIYFSSLLRTLGITSIGTQNALSGIVFLLGIVLGYRLMLGLTGNLLFASLFLLYLGVDHASSSVWTFNIHRAFAYVSVLGVIYCFFVSLRDHKFSLLNVMAMALCSILLLGADYMFFFSVLTTCAFLALLWRSETLNYFDRIKALVVLGGCFGVAFLLRQAQVILGAGFRIWERDFLFQVLNRIGLEKLYSGDYSTDTVSFYESNHIQNPGLAPVMPLNDRALALIRTLGTGLRTFVLSGDGLNAAYDLWLGVLLLVAFALAFLLRTAADLSFSRTWSITLNRVQRMFWILCAAVLFWSFYDLHVSKELSNLLGPSQAAIYKAAIAVVSIAGFSIGSLLIFRATAEPVGTNRRGNEFAVAFAFLCAATTMYVVFNRYYVQWFPAYNFLCIVTTVLFSAIVSSLFPRAPRPAALATALGLLLATKLLPFYPDVVAPGKGHSEYAASLTMLEGKTFASNFIPEAVSSYTQNFTTMLSDKGLVFLAQNKVVSLGSRYLFSERDVDNPMYLFPQYIMLFYSYGPPGKVRALAERVKSAGAPLVAQGDSFAIFKVYDTLPEIKAGLALATSLQPPNELQCARPTATSIELSWKLPDIEARYFLVEAKVGDSEFREIGMAGGGSDTIRLISMNPLTTYVFRLRSRVEHLFSDYSATAVCAPASNGAVR